MSQERLIERLRVFFADQASVREVSMFGGRAFMIDDKLVVSAHKNGDLLVRVAAASHEELTTRHGARQAEMGKGRTMGQGWIAVDAESIAEEDDLGFWVEAGLSNLRRGNAPDA